jgi:hypothetical protein
MLLTQLNNIITTKVLNVPQNRSLWPELLTCILLIAKLEIHYWLKCFDNKNVVVASSDAEIYSVVQCDT